MASDLRKCTFGDSRFFFEKMRYSTKKSEKNLGLAVFVCQQRKRVKVIAGIRRKQFKSRRCSMPQAVIRLVQEHSFALRDEGLW